MVDTVTPRRARGNPDPDAERAIRCRTRSGAHRPDHRLRVRLQCRGLGPPGLPAAQGARAHVHIGRRARAAGHRAPRFDDITRGAEQRLHHRLRRCRSRSASAGSCARGSFCSIGVPQYAKLEILSFDGQHGDVQGPRGQQLRIQGPRARPPRPLNSSDRPEATAPGSRGEPRQPRAAGRPVARCQSSTPCSSSTASGASCWCRRRRSRPSGTPRREEVARRKRAKEPADELMAALKASGEEVKRLDARLREIEAALETQALGIPNFPSERDSRRRRVGQPGAARRGASRRASTSSRVRTGSSASRSGCSISPPAPRSPARVSAVPRSGRPTGAGAPRVHARRAHPRARLRGDRAAVPREPRRRSSAPVSSPSSRRSSTAPRPTTSSSFPRPRCRSPTSIGTTSSTAAALPIALHRLDALFPAGGRRPRQGHPRAHPGPPVRQGGAGPLLPAGGLGRGARADDAPRRDDPRATRAPVPRARAGRGRHGLPQRAHARPRGVGRRRRRLARSLELELLHRFSGAPREHPLPPRRQGQARAGAHAQRLGRSPFPRTIIALLENNQAADGSVRVPAALAPYFGSDRLVPRA